MKPLPSRRLLAILAIASPLCLRAELKLNPLFSDHAVLQAGMDVPIWGTALPSQKVHVRFAGQDREAIADASGKWLMRLQPLAPSEESRTLEVEAEGSKMEVKDVLVGEVWLAGGQSNMAYPVGSLPDAAQVLPGAEDPELRFYTVAKKTADAPQQEASGKWETSNPLTAKGFSAAAYFFARDLRHSLHCPVAIVHSSWGGTPIETWIGLDAFRREPVLTRPLKDWDKALNDHRRVQADPSLESSYLAALDEWKKNVGSKYDAALKAYRAAESEGKAVGEPPKPATPEPTNPDPMGMPSPSRRPQAPSVSFNAMIAPLVPYGIRGFLWYQGEANASAGMDYRLLLPRLIDDWRRRWGAELPFLYVQLPANGKNVTAVAENGWPWLREAQLMALREPRTGMAITIDIGDPANVHPSDKVDVGLRLARLARGNVYGEAIETSGPLPSGFAIEGGHIRVRFAHTGGGLTPGQAPWRAKGVEPLPTDRLLGFYVAGTEKLWVEAQATIEGDTVVVSSPAVPNPVAVRYGWAQSPRCNLYNREGLPASPFRTDNWPK